MNKYFLLIPLLLNCNPYTIQNAVQSPGNNCHKTSCNKYPEYFSNEYYSIDSIFKSKGMYLSIADTVLNRYKDNLTSFLTNNNAYFSKHDTILLYFAYQPENKLKLINAKCDSSTIKQLIKSINDSILTNTIHMDSSFRYCILMTYNAIRSNNKITIMNTDNEFSTINRGGRSKSNIMQTVMSILASMRYRYNKFLRDCPGIKGRLVMKFTINQKGIVIYAKVIESSLSHCEMEQKELEIIYRTRFTEIDTDIDLTSVVYPFVFSQ